MEDEVIPLASLSLTHVYYNPSDPVSYLCAFLALVPHALCVVYATLIWSTREAEVVLMFAGQLACEAVNFALKRLIKEERPKRIHGKGYGMPSSHAQFAFFWAVAVALFLIVRHNPRLQRTGSTRRRSPASGADGLARRENGTVATPPPQLIGAVAGLTMEDVERFAHRPWSLVERAGLSAFALLLASMVAWSRIYLGYHTPKQVLAGCLAGALSAAAWFGITFAIRQTGLLVFALEMPVARWFRLRDLVIEEDVCQAGWEKWEDRAKNTRQDKAD